MIENIRLSFQGIISHKLRSFLTMLGIIIGIASIIAIVSTIQGTNKQIEQNLIGSGGNTVNVQIYEGDWPIEFSYRSVPKGLNQVRAETMQEIQNIEEVQCCATYLSRQDYEGVFYLSTSLSGGYIYGVSPTYFDTQELIMMKGRAFSDNDYKSFSKVAIIDKQAADTLFNGIEPIGKTIEVKSQPYTVIGVVTELNKFEPVINTVSDYYTYASQGNGAVYVTDATWPIIYGYDEPQSVIVKATSTNDMTNAGKKVADILNAQNTCEDENIKYKAQDLLEQAKQLQQLSSSTNTMLVWIAGISLLVGGIGVMNIMLVSVSERTNEIGLKKAIGARKGIILGQFLTEAVVLTSLGGIIGVGVGIALAQLISKINSIPVFISPVASIGGVVFSMAIGIIFGIIPSYKAANLDPIEALRHE